MVVAGPASSQRSARELVISAGLSSESRQRVAVEVPGRARVPQHHHRPDEQSSGQRQCPAREAAGANHSDLRRASTAPSATAATPLPRARRGSPLRRRYAAPPRAKTGRHRPSRRRRASVRTSVLARAWLRESRRKHRGRCSEPPSSAPCRCSMFALRRESTRSSRRQRPRPAPPLRGNTTASGRVGRRPRAGLCPWLLADRNSRTYEARRATGGRRASRLSGVHARPRRMVRAGHASDRIDTQPSAPPGIQIRSPHRRQRYYNGRT
jgi:hypothetical protein